MKKLGILLALVLAFAIAAPPVAAAYSTALNAVTTGTASAIIPSGGAANIEVYLRSAAGSTSTVTIELCAQNAAASCYIVVTVSNVAATGKWYQGPSGPFFRVNASAVSAGSVTALYGMNNGPRLAVWNDLKVPVVSGAGSLTLTDVTASGTVTGATLAATGGVTAGSTVAALGGVSGTTGTFSAGVSGTTGTFSGAISGTTLTGSGGVAGTTGTFSALTATRVPYVGTAGLLQDAATFTFTTSGGILDVTAIRPSGLTATRVPFAGTAGLINDASGFTYTAGALAVPTSVATPTFIGARQETIAAKASNGAIASAPGVIVITKGSALGSSTLATPTTTTHDGYVLTIVSSTAYAHVVSCASGKINGGSTTTVTFTSAGIGDSVTLVAYQGVWYIVGTTGTITLT
jgi:hypothetical protein